MGNLLKALFGKKGGCSSCGSVKIEEVKTEDQNKEVPNKKKGCSSCGSVKIEEVKTED